MKKNKPQTFALHDDLKFTEADVKEWQGRKTVEYAAQYGNGVSKSLECNLLGKWIVISHHKEIYRGTFKQAIKKYNALPSH